LLDLAYFGALALASPYLLYKAITRPRHVAGLRARLGRGPVAQGVLEGEPGTGGVLPRTGTAPCVWVHGVSVGEVVASEPLVRALETALPGHEVIITTTTSTGQAVARRKFPKQRIGYFPLDFSWAVRRVFDAVRPSLVVLVELELWPQFLAEAKARGVPVVVVNGRISARSFRGYRFLHRILPFNDVAHYCVQTEQYAQRFLKLGVAPEKVTVTGSMKYDNVQTSRTGGPEARASLGLGPDEAVWIAGSTHSPEERSLIEIFSRVKEDRPELRLVLAPRHNERAAEVARMVAQAGLVPVLRSAQIEGAPVSKDAIIIVDTLGELSRLYAAANLVFVGGSLIPHGGQNMLEPAALGKAVLFGPHVANFQESAERLLTAGGAIQVNDASELEARLRELLASPELTRTLGLKALEAIEAQKGATERTIAAIRPFCPDRPGVPVRVGNTTDESQKAECTPGFAA
jgi:3-deoxy-D-manno-octulosonic-acid transferase